MFILSVITFLCDPFILVAWSYRACLVVAHILNVSEILALLRGYRIQFMDKTNIRPAVENNNEN
jgi:hypothetical protein